MNRLVNAILTAAVVLTSLVATSSTLSVKGKVLTNGKQGSYDPFDPDLPSWRADNGPSAVDWNDEVRYNLRRLRQRYEKHCVEQHRH